MNSKDFGSFSIVCRLFQSLRKLSAGSNANTVESAARRERLLAAFFEKYSSNPTDLRIFFELALCEVPPIHCPGGKLCIATKSPTQQSASSAILDDFLVSKTKEAVDVATVPFATVGSLSLSEAHGAIRQLRAHLLLSLRILQGGVSPTAAIDWQLVVVPSTSPQEWEVMRSIAIGDIGAVVGGTTAKDLLSILGPTALQAYRDFRSRSGDISDESPVAAAVAASCDSSPRMLRESSCVIVLGPDDDMAAGFASSDDDKPQTTTAPPAKRERTPTMEPHTTTFATHDVRRLEDGAGPAKLHPCMYGEHCRRKNPDHFKKYSHPPLAVKTSLATTTIGDAICGAMTTTASPSASLIPCGGARESDAATTRPHQAADAPLDPKAFAINGVVPLKAMKEFEFVMAENTGGSYKMKNCGGGTYTCNCPVWRYQNKGTNERTCKHLQAYLGVEFERARCCAGDEPTVALAVGAGTAACGKVGGAKKVAMPGVLLANKASNKSDYTGWWVSEKLDGVRCYWDGQHMLSRNGNAFTAPDWFTSVLPRNTTLDGELFGGRKKFQTTVGIVKSSASHPGWATLTYEIFDIPSSGANPFEARMTELNGMFPKGGAIKHVHVVEQELCSGAQHISDRLAEVEGLGGEGLMLREPKSKYVNSRSNTLLKVKSTEECDAIVRGHDPGKGKHAGRCGALLVELANGKQFCVGSGLTDAQRSAPPPVGTVVVVRFQELTDGGIPRFPVFNGCRYDIDWPPKGPPAK